MKSGMPDRKLERKNSVFFQLFTQISKFFRSKTFHRKILECRKLHNNHSTRNSAILGFNLSFSFQFLGLEYELPSHSHYTHFTAESKNYYWKYYKCILLIHILYFRLLLFHIFIC